MSSAEDESQQTAPPEVPSTAPLEGAEDAAPLPELEAVGTGAESVDEASSERTADAADEKPRSARERLNTRAREGRPKKKRGGFIALLVIVLLLLGALGAAVGGFAYLYWYANDDALDFEGTWYVAGTDTPIEITSDSIRLTDSVAYRYKLNTHDKTITLTLGNMTGYGSYRFSLDRSELVIFDGRANPRTVLETDIRWLVKAWFDDMQNKPNDVTSGIRRNRTLLTREPGVTPYADSASSNASQAENEPGPSGESEEPQTVWSAEEWLNSLDDAEDGASSASGSNSSDVNDVNSLLEGINDLPADPVPAPQDAGDQAAPESPSS